MQSACAVPINSFKSALNSPRNHRALLVLNPHTSAALKRLVGPHFTAKYLLHSNTTLSLEERKLSILYLEMKMRQNILLKLIITRQQ